MHASAGGQRIDRAVTLVDARTALVEVYRYLQPRCGSTALAEDLTSEAVLAAVDRLTAGQIDRLTVPYVLGIAKHKLVDHWRRAERDRRRLTLLRGGVDEALIDAGFEPDRSAATLNELSPMHRAALTLRYVDDLSVSDVAALLGRSVTATETLLVRAKRAFRDAYARTEGDDA